MKAQTDIPNDVFLQVLSESASYIEAAKKLCVSHIYVELKAKLLKVTPGRKSQGRSFNNCTYTADQIRELYLSNKKAIASGRLRTMLIRSGIKEARCEYCNQSVWMGYPIPLELHHKNQDHDDNTEDNLLLVCPTCHALITAKDKLDQKKQQDLTKARKRAMKDFYSKYGYPADAIHGRKFNIDKDSLLCLFRDLRSYRAVGAYLGVSDAAVKKRCKRLGIHELIKPIIREHQRENAARNRKAKRTCTSIS